MIPVILFHSIGIENSSWSQRYLSSPLVHFDEFCRYLKEKKYETIFLDEWYRIHDADSERIYNKIVLTFDDGYLDNWVYVYPIIKKYGFKVTIFVNPEFVDPSEEPRLTLEHVWENKIAVSELQPVGFLNWSEMRIMEQSGLVDIQSHSMTHNTYFQNDTLIDFYDGSEKYDWLPWMYHKDKKPFYMRESLLDLIPKGIPIFSYDRSLSVRRFLPSDAFNKFCISEYNKYLNKNNISSNNKKQLVEELRKQIICGTVAGRYETDNEIMQRYEYELEESKRIIEEQLNKKIHYLCWPGGRYNEKSLRMSIDAGYRASTATKKSEGISIYSDDNYKRIRRIGMSSKTKTSRDLLFRKTNRGLIYCYREHTGNIPERWIVKTKRRVLQIV